MRGPDQRGASGARRRGDQGLRGRPRRGHATGRRHPARRLAARHAAAATGSEGVGGVGRARIRTARRPAVHAGARVRAPPATHIRRARRWAYRRGRTRRNPSHGAHPPLPRRTGRPSSMASPRTGFTTRASCLLAAGATALACGLLLGIVDLARAGVLALAVPLLAASVVLRSRVQVANRRSAEPARAAAGETVVVHLTISNRSRLSTGALMLEDQLPGQLRGNARFVLDGLSSRETRTVSYRMPGLPRGQYRTGPLHIPGSPTRSTWSTCADRSPRRTTSPCHPWSRACATSTRHDHWMSATMPAATRSGRTARTTRRPASTGSATTSARSTGGRRHAPER